MGAACYVGKEELCFNKLVYSERALDFQYHESSAGSGMSPKQM
jgi:hypothetical protein